MSMYYCSRCGSLKDNDYCVCTEDPNDSLGLMCEDCACEMEEPSMEVRQNGAFSQSQLETIAKLESEENE